MALRRGRSCPQAARLNIIATLRHAGRQRTEVYPAIHATISVTAAERLEGVPGRYWHRLGGHPKPQDLPPAVAYDQQTIEQSKRDCRHDEEVHCDNAIRMVAKER